MPFCTFAGRQKGLVERPLVAAIGLGGGGNGSSASDFAVAVARLSVCLIDR